MGHARNGRGWDRHRNGWHREVSSVFVGCTGPLNSKLMTVDQAAIDAALFFRRYAVKPMPAKPRIIIAHVEGSGTALTW